MAGNINCTYGFSPGDLFRLTMVLSFCLVQLSSAQSSRKDELELATEIGDPRATGGAQTFWGEHSPSNGRATILQVTSSTLANITRQTRHPENSLTRVALRTHTQYSKVRTDQTTKPFQRSHSIDSKPKFIDSISENSLKPLSGHPTVFEQLLPSFSLQSTRTFAQSKLSAARDILKPFSLDGASASLNINADRLHSSHIQRNFPNPLPATSTALKDQASKQLGSSQTNLKEPKHKIQSSRLETPSLSDRATMGTDKTSKGSHPSTEHSTSLRTAFDLAHDALSSSLHHTAQFTDQTSQHLQPSFSAYQPPASLSSITPSFRRATVFIDQATEEAQPHSSKQSTQGFQRSILKIEHTTSMLSQDHSVSLNDVTSRPLRPSQSDGPTQRLQGRVTSNNSNELFIPLLSDTPQRRLSHAESSTLISPPSRSGTGSSVQSFRQLTQSSSENSKRLQPSHPAMSGQNFSRRRFNINQDGSSASVFGHSPVLNNHSKGSYGSSSVQTTLKFQRGSLKTPSGFSLPLPDHSTLFAHQTEGKSHPSNVQMESTRKLRNSTSKTGHDPPIPFRGHIIARSSSYLRSTTLPISTLKAKSSTEEQNRLPPISHLTVFPYSPLSTKTTVLLPKSRVVPFTDTVTVSTSVEKAFAQVHHTTMSLNTAVLDSSPKSKNNINVSSSKPTEITNAAKSQGTKGVMVILVAAVLPGVVVVCMLCCFFNNKVSSVRERRSRVAAAEKARQLERKRHGSQASLLSAWTSREFFVGHMPAKESKLKETISVDLSWRHEGSESSTRNEEDSSITTYMDGNLVSGNPEGSLSTSERSIVDSCKQHNRNRSSSSEHILFNVSNGNNIKNPPERRSCGATDSCMVNEGRVTNHVCKLPPIKQNVRYADSLPSISNMPLEEGANDKDHSGEQLIPMLPIRKPAEKYTLEDRSDAVTEKTFEQLDDSITPVPESNRLAQRKKEFRRQRWREEASPTVFENNALSQDRE